MPSEGDSQFCAERAGLPLFTPRHGQVTPGAGRLQFFILSSDQDDRVFLKCALVLEGVVFLECLYNPITPPSMKGEFA